LLSLQTVVSAKDDHTLFFGPSSIFVVQRYVHENMSFDPETDLAPIAGVAKVQIAIAVPTSLGISTLAEFVALARAKPNETSYAVAPGFSEFVFDGFVKENGLAIAKVPYRDITKSPVDLGENRIQLSMQSYAAMRTYAHSLSGRSRIPVLARQSRARPPRAPRYAGRLAPAGRGGHAHRARRQDDKRKIGAHGTAGHANGRRRVHRRAQRAIHASRPYRVCARHREEIGISQQPGKSLVHNAPARNPTHAWFCSLGDAAIASVGVSLWAESGHPDLTTPRQLLTQFFAQRVKQCQRGFDRWCGSDR
jgi:hypothetical protein